MVRWPGLKSNYYFLLEGFRTIEPSTNRFTIGSCHTSFLGARVVGVWATTCEQFFLASLGGLSPPNLVHPTVKCPQRTVHPSLSRGMNLAGVGPRQMMFTLGGLLFSSQVLCLALSHGARSRSENSRVENSREPGWIPQGMEAGSSSQ